MRASGGKVAARKPPACRHCVIWSGRDGTVTRRCAHCAYVAGTFYEPDEDLLLRQVAHSRRQHKEYCSRPVR